MNPDQIYFSLADKIMSEGMYRKNDRTGIGTYSLFGEKLEYDVSSNFPLLQTKQVWWPGVAHELVWFLKGETNIKYLKENKVRIWDAWADVNGDLGPVYGKQWRDWNGNDQIKSLISGIKEDPSSRRHIVNAWNVDQIKEMALPPCHMMFQVYVREDYLDLQLYQRSGDYFLGVPFNLASYSLLLYILSKAVNKKPGKFIHVFGDVHIYENHVEAIKTQKSRLENIKEVKPELYVKDFNDIDEITFNHFILSNYFHEGKIKADVAI